MANQKWVFPKGVFGMTQREREILKASVSWTDKALTVKEEKAFQAGAKWADKTMIEKACKKACKWLRECLSDNITYVPETFYGQPKPIISEEGLKNFIKYLEEQL